MVKIPWSTPNNLDGENSISPKVWVWTMSWVKAALVATLALWTPTMWTAEDRKAAVFWEEYQVADASGIQSVSLPQTDTLTEEPTWQTVFEQEQVAMATMSFLNEMTFIEGSIREEFDARFQAEFSPEEQVKIILMHQNVIPLDTSKLWDFVKELRVPVPIRKAILEEFSNNPETAAIAFLGINTQSVDGLLHGLAETWDIDGKLYESQILTYAPIASDRLPYQQQIIAARAEWERIRAEWERLDVSIKQLRAEWERLDAELKAGEEAIRTWESVIRKMN